MKTTGILFVDPCVADYEILLKGVVAGIEVVVIDPDQDGVAQITQVLSQGSGVESVHIVSHGSPGTLYLGNSELSLSTLELYADQIQTWFPNRLLLYGCNVAAGDAGAEFIAKLHQLTRAEIAATSKRTGSAALGGDWQLEFRTGEMDTELAFQPEVMETYSAVLVGPDDSVYVANTTTFESSLNLVAGTTNVQTISDISNDDDESVAIDLGNNTFRFYGTDYTGNNQLFVSSNGLITFGNSNSLASNTDLTSSPSGAAIAVLWDNWKTNVNSAPDDQVLYQIQDVDNDGTSDRLVIEWNDVRQYVVDEDEDEDEDDDDDGNDIANEDDDDDDGNDIANEDDDDDDDDGGNDTANDNNTVTFQAILQLNTGTTNAKITFNYPDLNLADGVEGQEGSSATVGIKAPGTEGMNRLLLSQNSSSSFYVGTGKAVQISAPPPNNAPMLLNTNVTLSAISTGAGAPVGAVGTLVSSLVSLGGNVTDSDTDALTGIAIASVNTTNGTWFYSINNGTNWESLGSVSTTTARLLATNTNTRIYFQPNANFNGSISDALTFYAWDQTFGINGGTANTTVSGGASAFSSITATAAITVNTAPANDNFANRILLSGTSGSRTTNNVGATGELGEPVQSGTINSVWWSWTAQSSGLVTFDTSDSELDTYLTAYTGNAVNSLTLVAQNDDIDDDDDDDDNNLDSRVSFAATAGTTYQIAVDGFDSDTGDITLNYSFTPNGSPDDNDDDDDDDVTAPNLKKLSNNIFQLSDISGGIGKLRLQVTLEARSSSLVNELGVCVVDDEQGTINGIAPGTEGYVQAALLRSQVIFSAIANVPNGFNTDLTRLLEFNAGERLRFFKVNNTTIDAVLASNTSFTNVIFSETSTVNVTEMGNGQFTLAWSNASASSTSVFQDLVVNVQATNQPLPLGAGLQGNRSSELIDLRSVTTQVRAEFVLNREAAFDNFVGFYQVADINGGIDTDGNGTVDLLPGDAGYAQAAVRGRIAGIDLTVSNQVTATFTGTFQPGTIFAPFIIADSTSEAILDSNASNDPAVYFAFLGANQNQVDHVRLLGNNTFGFEDLPNGGDLDYNDVTLRVNLSIA